MLKPNDMIVITDSNYWDCDCDNNYIHKKSITLSCPVCKMTEDECSDSRPNEIKLHYKDYKEQEVLKPNDMVRIKGTCIVGSISRINHAENLALFEDEEINKHIYIAINKLEKLYE